MSKLRIIPLMKVLTGLTLAIGLLGHVYAYLVVTLLAQESEKLATYQPLYLAGTAVNFLLFAAFLIYFWQILSSVQADAVFSTKNVARVDRMLRLLAIDFTMIIALGVFYLFAVGDGGPPLLMLLALTFVILPAGYVALRVARNVFVDAVSRIRDNPIGNEALAV